MENSKEKDICEKESTILEWTAPEFIVYSRSWRWYTFAFVALAGVFLYSLFVKDWFIAFLAVFMGIALFFNTKRQAKEVKYRITQLGVYIDGLFHPFAELHSFWLTLNAEQRILNIVFQKKYLPALPILFYGVDPLVLKNTLAHYIPEQEDRTETLTDKLTRILKI